jgi:hypothetical protein
MLDVPGPLQLATDFYLLPMVKVQGCFLASCSAWRPIYPPDISSGDTPP